jgi:hypothetical protein
LFIVSNSVLGTIWWRSRAVSGFYLGSKLVQRQSKIACKSFAFCFCLNHVGGMSADLVGYWCCEVWWIQSQRSQIDESWFVDSEHSA